MLGPVSAFHATEKHKFMEDISIKGTARGGEYMVFMDDDNEDGDDEQEEDEEPDYWKK
ncbi:MAG TPA: hypothetical protein VJ485_01475 [archaeon]|nr:hypothetical protein [archaeon]